MPLFSANPLSLSVPEPAFETWLRDTGYLDLLDDRAAAAAAAGSSSSVQSPSTPHPPSSSSSSPFNHQPLTAAPFDPLRCTRRVHGSLRRIGASVYSSVRTVLSILTLNPFSKLTAEDFAGETPPWTVGFISSGADQASYSWPAGPAQARMRVQENVKRYARNYAALALLILACSLYQMPKSLLGLLACLGLWEGLRLCSERWGLEERFPIIRSALFLIAQFATAFVLYYCNLQIAVLCAISFSYAVMIIHASLRKLSASKQSVGANWYKRPQLRRYRS